MIEQSTNCIALQLNCMNCIHAVSAILFVCFGFFFWQQSVAFTTGDIQWKMPLGKHGIECVCKSGVGECVRIYFVFA